MLQIQLIGQFDVRLDGKRILISSRAGQSLLGYLAMTSGTGTGTPPLNIVGSLLEGK